METSASGSDLAQYIAQEGDTVESIAQNTGTSPNTINALNPGIQNSGPASGQPINVPSPAKSPVQGAVPAPNGGTQPVNLPASGFPGILPVFQPGFTDQTIWVPADTLPQPPVFFPTPSAPVTGGFAAPSDYQIKVNDCKVSVSWKDNASEEESYLVGRDDKITPGFSTAGSFTLPANTTSFEDILTSSGGLVGYEVNAIRTEGNQKIFASGPLQFVQVPFSKNCAGGAKQVVLQPVSFQSTNLAMTEGFINVSLQDFSAIRFPRGQQTSFPLGSWDNPFLRWIIPLPDLSSGETLTLEMQGNLLSSRNSPPLAEQAFKIQHAYDDLAAPDAQNIIHQAKNDRINISYRIWLEPLHDWGSVSAPRGSTLVPAPYNLQIQESATQHTVSWKHDSPGVIDGFVLKSTYYCGGILNTGTNCAFAE